MRVPLFPNCPAYLHFITPEEEYEEDPQSFHAAKLAVRVARNPSQSVLDCFTRLGVSLQPWDLSTNLSTSGGPVWDHVLVCEKGHFIPFDNLHPAVKVNNFFFQFSSKSTLKVNAFPSTSALDRKNKLWTCYTRLQARMGRRACNFIPENYNLPAQKHQLMAKVCRIHHSRSQ